MTLLMISALGRAHKIVIPPQSAVLLYDQTVPPRWMRSMLQFPHEHTEAAPKAFLKTTFWDRIQAAVLLRCSVGTYVILSSQQKRRSELWTA